MRWQTGDECSDDAGGDDEEDEDGGRLFQHQNTSITDDMCSGPHGPLQCSRHTISLTIVTSYHNPQVSLQTSN